MGSLWDWHSFAASLQQPVDEFVVLVTSGFTRESARLPLGYNVAYCGIIGSKKNLSTASLNAS